MTTTETMAIVGACIAALAFLANAAGGLALFVRIGRLLESHDNLRVKVDEHVDADKTTHDLFAGKLQHQSLQIARIEQKLWNNDHPSRNNDSGPR